MAYPSEAVTRQLQKAAAFLLYTTDKPGEPDSPVFAPNGTNLVAGIDLVRDLYHLDVQMRQSSPWRAPWATPRTGQTIGRLEVRLRLAPDDFSPAPGREPPLTVLDPTRPQRFVLLDGLLSFDDRASSGIRGFGHGRTVPLADGTGVQLNGVWSFCEGRGALQVLPGLGTFAGTLLPPDRVRCALAFHFLDRAGKVLTGSRLHPVQWVQEPHPDVSYLTFRGEADPESPRMLIAAQDGGSRGAHMTELLRLSYVGFDLGEDRKHLRTRTITGPIVARLTHRTFFRTGSAKLFEMNDLRFTFFDADGEVGTLRAERVEGAVAERSLAGGPLAMQIAGAGALSGGTGPFPGEGTVLVNGALTLFPDAFSTLYVFRVIDPQGRLRDTLTGSR